MLIHSDFLQRAAVLPQHYQWIASPQPGVERVMLDRIGEEKARATSIVRYAPASRFPGHPHPGGEEILVLSGTFSDEHGDYPAGWYLRNPHGSSHQPFTHEGAVIFVKLRQMPEKESRSVRINTHDASNWTEHDVGASCPLFADEREQVSVEKRAAGRQLVSQFVDGAEVLVLEGSLNDAAQEYGEGSWLRLPPGTYSELVAGLRGATVYLKTGHLGEYLTGAMAP
ncbi:cupin domain-containing protein [Advenella mimigardefordensis]|uniref:Putative anti-sigma factor n=1 Tax=Advenella mimigardefordensis (strain DSM 17166 / LMG 22922 / DPN7) TaxID=1247726 RepID=W0PEW1_ADVMD|nr:cupin domain-containing protein [Advenella mimigardefordensis]AHG63810.1 putative anti-sigma factor [Advenella mimigardefordensis DPN7]